jgi:hypothetical protein
MPKEDNDFLQRNRSVKSVHVKDGNTMVIKLKTGSTEEYNLDDNDEFKAAVAKYGKLPVFAVPAPPAAPNPPNPSSPETSAVTAVQVEPQIATTVNVTQQQNVVAVDMNPVIVNTRNFTATTDVNVVSPKPKVSVTTTFNAVKAERPVKQ